MLNEVLEFFGDGPERLAGCTHLPAGEPVGGVVICSSLYNEFLKNYRREVVLARSLAARGFAVQRFQYRGTGNSDGEPEDTTFQSMCDDAALALQRLRQATGLADVAFLATRFGALVAANAAAGIPGAPVALIEPVFQADRFFNEGFKTKLFAQGIRLKEQTNGAPGPARSVGDLVAQLEETGAVDVLGYTIGVDLYRSSGGRTVAGELGSQPRPLLALQLDAASPIKPVLERAAGELREQGIEVELDRVGSREVWWMAEEREEVPGEIESRAHGLSGDDELVSMLGDWLHRHVSAAVQP